MIDADIRHNINTGKSLNHDDIVRVVGQKICNEGTFEFVNGPTTLSHLVPHKVIFLDRVSDSYMPALLDQDNQNCLFILPVEGDLPKIVVPHIRVAYPRITYANIINEMFGYPHTYFSGYYSEDELQQAFPEVSIMPGCHIHKTATIGKNSMIMPGVVIGPACTIGENVLIKSNVVIGQPGFGIIKQDNLEHIHLPHVGGVLIGDRVEIGTLVTISSGTIHPTIIHEYVKINDLVHIAHNCNFAKGVQIAAQAEISGSVKIGQGSWIGPNCSINNGIEIGENVTVGMASNVTKSIPSNTRAIGNPARVMPQS